MILWNGKLLPDSERSACLDALEDRVQETLSGPPLEAETVIAALETLGGRLDRGELNGFIARYVPATVLDQLDSIRWMLRRESLEYKLEVELGNPGGKRPFGRCECHPLGVLLHIAPGNMEGLPVFTVVEGLLTGNLNLLKLPHGDRGLSLALLSLLIETEPRLAPWICAFDLPSQNTPALKRLAEQANGIVVWGGDGAITAVRALAPPGCRLVEWGHRLSFAYWSGWEDETRERAALAWHIVRTGGLLCSSCQVIYLDTEDRKQAESFCRELIPALETAVLGQGQGPGMLAQASLYARETWLEHLTDRAGTGEKVFRGKGCTVTLRPDAELELSPLHGNVLVKCLPRQQLGRVLRRQKGRLQTAGLICTPQRRRELTALLAAAGVTRITRPGHMSDSFSGEAHDGEYPLRRYVRMVDIED